MTYHVLSTSLVTLVIASSMMAAPMVVQAFRYRERLGSVIRLFFQAAMALLILMLAAWILIQPTINWALRPQQNNSTV